MSELKIKEHNIYTPEPYYKITFGCLGYKGMYRKLRTLLWELWEASGIDDDFNNGYYSETCDYEGDLEKIIIYKSSDEECHNFTGKLKPFLNEIEKYFDVDLSKVDEDMNIVFSEY